MRKTVLIATVAGPRPVEAEVMRLYVGAYQEKFFVHDSGAETVLSHYGSGQRVGALGAIKLAHAVRWGTGGTITNREAAKVLLAQVVERNGDLAAVRKMRAAPVINGAKVGEGKHA